MTNKQKRKILDSYINAPSPSRLDKSNQIVVRYRQKGKTFDKRTIVPVAATDDDEKKLLKENSDLYLAIQVGGDSKTGLSKRTKDNVRTFDLNDLQIVSPTKVKQK